MGRINACLVVVLAIAVSAFVPRPRPASRRGLPCAATPAEPGADGFPFDAATLPLLPEETTSADDPALAECLRALETAKAQYRRLHEPVTIPHHVSDDLQWKFSEAARGCNLDFHKDSHTGLWRPTLVKMEGKMPHGACVGELVRQLGNDAERRYYDKGVEPMIVATMGQVEVDESKNVDTDVAVKVDDGDDRLHRFLVEVDHEGSSPRRQAERVAQLFEDFGVTLRAVLTIKFYYRRRDGRFPACCVVYGKDDADIVHVRRAFDVGTVRSAIEKAPVRKVWDENGWMLDAAVDDGTADGFAIESYDFLPDSRLPPRPPTPEIADHFRVSIDEADLYYGAAAYEPPTITEPLVLDLYRAMFRVDRELPPSKKRKKPRRQRQRRSTNPTSTPAPKTKRKTKKKKKK